MFRRRVWHSLLASALLASLVAFSSPAWAGGTPSIVGDAGIALRSDPVYVDPGMAALPANQTLSSAQIRQLTAMIQGSPRPIYLAVLPESVQAEVGTPTNLIPDLAGATGLAGIYVAVAGPAFRGGATDSEALPQAGDIAGDVYNQHHQDGVFVMFQAFVQQVDSIQLAGSATTVDSSSGSTNLTWLWILLLVIAVIGLATFAILRSRRRKALKQLHDALVIKYNRANATLIRDHEVSDFGYEEATGLGVDTKELLDGGLSMANLDEAAQMLTRFERAVNQLGEMRPDTSAASRNVVRDRLRSVDNSGRGGIADRTPRASRAGSRRQQPSHGQSTVVNNYHVNTGWGGTPWLGYYPGTGYGYYPGMGWGYYGDNGFVEGMLLGELAAGQQTSWNDWASQTPGVVVDSSGGGGDWNATSGSDPATTSGGGGDWGASGAGSDGSSDTGAGYSSPDTGGYSSPDYGSSSDSGSYSSPDYGSSSDSGSYGGGSDYSSSDSGGGGSFDS